MDIQQPDHRVLQQHFTKVVVIFTYLYWILRSANFHAVTFVTQAVCVYTVQSDAYPIQYYLSYMRLDSLVFYYKHKGPLNVSLLKWALAVQFQTSVFNFRKLLLLCAISSTICHSTHTTTPVPTYCSKFHNASQVKAGVFTSLPWNCKSVAINHINHISELLSCKWGTLKWPFLFL